MSNSSPPTFNTTANIELQLKGGVKDTGVCSLNPQLWFVYPINGDTSSCSPGSSILRTFGLVNLAVAILSLILGHRAVTNLLTCGIFGRKRKTQWGLDKFGIPVPRSILYTWLLPIVLQFCANAVNAAMMKSTANYEQGFDIIQVTILYLSRPRITWLIGFLMIHFCPQATPTSNKNSQSIILPTIESSEPCSEIGLGMIPVPVPNLDSGIFKAESHTLVSTAEETIISPRNTFTFNLEEWQAWAYQQILAEFALQFITAVIGITVSSCQGSGISTIVSGYATLELGWPIIYIPMIFLSSLVMFAQRKPNKKRWRGILGLLQKHLAFLFTLLFASLLWGSRWSFWVYYLNHNEVFGFCPPKLTQQSLIWISFSVIAAPLGHA